MAKEFLITCSTWNKLEFTKLCIQSILEHTNWDMVKEMVVWDNNSTDGTWEFLQTTPLETIQGDFPSSNFGINKIMERHKKDLPPFLIKIDNDFCVKPNWLEEIKKVFDTHEKAGSVYLYSTRWQINNKGYMSPKRLHKVKLEPRKNPNGGVFATRCDLLKSFGRFGTSKRYTGCQRYAKEIKGKGFKLFTLSVAYELADHELQKKYINKGWERKKKKNRHLW